MRYCKQQLVGLTVLTCALGGRGLGQEPKANPGANKKPTTLYFGVSACANCHTNPPTDSPPLLCRCNEILVWKKEDKHKDAYTNLFKERAQQMVKILQIKDVGNEKSCVTCHGVFVADASQKHPSFKAEDGVSCVACHGPYKDWIDKHGGIDREEWRKKTRREKEDVWGMTDLWDPAKRAKKCASCHIGNAEEGKIVTHAMYAAGHPPLPGVEVSTFSDAMPRHWQYLKEKNDEAKKLLEYKPGELEKTQLVVVGGVVDLQQAMNLLAAQADAQARMVEPEKRSLDLAQIDCYACHHELKVPGWRQARGYSGIPGRPQFRQWPLALVKLALHHAGQEKRTPELEKRLSTLRMAFDAQPFGKLDDVARAARDLANWCARLEADLAQKNIKYDRAAAVRLLGQLCSLSATEVPDYDTARQMAWAANMMYSDLAESEPKPANHSEIQAKLKALDEELKLSLPSGQEHQLLAELPLALQKIGEYNPGKVQQIFQDLAKLLPPK
jgi:hypothetical protein